MSVKDEAEGRVEAVFSTFNVVDLDGDVTVPGAFTEGAPVKISAYGHESWLGALPVGRGTIRVEDDKAILDGQFFLSTDHGRNTFETVRLMGELQEWSYGYDAVKWSMGQHEDRQVRFLEQLIVHEVSPVLRGAGIDTRTLAVKGLALDVPVMADEAEAFVDVQVERMRHAAKEGRVLSSANRTRLQDMRSGMVQVMEAIDALLSETEPDDEGKAALRREFMRYVATAHDL
jgi:HK97 family phage prohead protease